MNNEQYESQKPCSDKKSLKNRKRLKNNLEKETKIIENEAIEDEDIIKSMNVVKESLVHVKKTEKLLFRINVIYGLFFAIGILMLCYFVYLFFEIEKRFLWI